MSNDRVQPLRAAAFGKLIADQIRLTTTILARRAGIKPQ